MHIYGPAHLHGAQPVGPPHSARISQPQAPDSRGSIQDELQLSDAARMVDKLHQIPDLRQDRVNQLRAQIAAGTYATDEKLDIAIGRLLDEIG